MFRLLPFLPLLLLPTLTAVPAAAQNDTPTSRFEDRVEVTEVLLDVVATDKKGRVVRGLSAEDFRVEEEGEPVEITGVSFYTTQYEDGDAAGEVAEIPSSRYFIFLFHDQRRAVAGIGQFLQRQLEAGRTAARWVREEMGPSDWVAVAGYDVKLELYQDFSQDRGALEQAIADAVRGKQADVLPPSERRRRAASGPSLLAQLPPQPQLGDETKQMYAAIQQLAEASGPIVGRKNLLLFSIGFGELDGSSPFNRPDPRYYPETREALNANNVAVYPIDLTPTGVEHSQTSFLNQLANESGGYYQRSFISFITPLRQIAKENVGYYALSYRAEHPIGEHGYREVTVKSTAPKVILRARRGFRFGVDSEADIGI